MGVIVLSADLSIAALVPGAAQRTGVAAAVAMSVAALRTKVAADPPHLIVIDLEFPGLAIDTLAAELRTAAPHAKLLAFGPHVHEQKLQAAQSAGCDTVLPRGQFHAQLDAIFAQAGANATGA